MVKTLNGNLHLGYIIISSGKYPAFLTSKERKVRLNANVCCCELDKQGNIIRFDSSTTALGKVFVMKLLQETKVLGKQFRMKRRTAMNP